MWKVIILICAIGTDRTHCTNETAVDVLIAPETAASLMSCGLIGQVYLAESGIDMNGYWPKIFCRSGNSEGPTVASAHSRGTDWITPS
jgi:hypothetical protein